MSNPLKDVPDLHEVVEQPSIIISDSEAVFEQPSIVIEDTEIPVVEEVAAIVESTASATAEVSVAKIWLLICIQLFSFLC